MLCTTGRPLSLGKWLAVPFLFAATVLGLTGTAGLLIGSFAQVPLSSPVFGAATAVAAAASGTVQWTARWQRHWLRWPYLAVVLTMGIVLGGVEIPAVAAALLGVPTTLILVGQVIADHRDDEPAPSCSTFR